MSAPEDARRGPLDYLVLLVVCATAFLAGLVEVLLVPLYSGTVIIPVTVVLGMVTTYALPRLGFWLTGTVGGGLLPLVAWFVATLGLSFVGRPEADVVVEGGNAQQWVLFALIVVGAVVGFATIVRVTGAAAPVRPPVSR